MGPARPALRFDLRIGRTLRAHGLAGDVVVQLFRARPWEADRQADHRCEPPVPVELVFRDHTSEVVGLTRVKFVRPTTAVVHLDGVDDREGAERVAHAFVDVDPRHPPEPLTDALDRLFGASVVDADTGEALGEVTRFLDTAAHPLLVLSDDETRLIPYVEAFVVRIDQDDRGPIIRVRLPEGLLEVNAPKKA